MLRRVSNGVVLVEGFSLRLQTTEAALIIDNDGQPRRVVRLMDGICEWYTAQPGEKIRCYHDDGSDFEAMALDDAALTAFECSIGDTMYLEF